MEELGSGEGELEEGVVGLDGEAFVDFGEGEIGLGLVEETLGGLEVSVGEVGGGVGDDAVVLELMFEGWGVDFALGEEEVGIEVFGEGGGQAREVCGDFAFGLEDDGGGPDVDVGGAGEEVVGVGEDGVWPVVLGGELLGFGGGVLA